MNIAIPTLIYFFISTLNGDVEGILSREKINQRNVIIPPLIVKEPPKIVSFKKHESFELNCEAVGTAPITYKWNFNGKEFDPSGLDDRVVIQPGVGTLIFTQPIKRDEGTYQCFASNSAGVSLSIMVDSRLAVLEPFMKQAQKTHRVRLGQPLKLNCVPPKSFPKAFIFWTKQTDDYGSTKPVETSNRISLDPEGNLLFSNVEASDRNSARYYSCVAQNTVTRTLQVGRRHYIVPQGGSVELLPPVVQWQMASHHIVLLGGRIKLTCLFSGSPTPTVQWLRGGDGSFLDSSRFRTDNYGRELLISNVQFQDSNTYECVGINTEARRGIHRTVKLVVESEPYWNDNGHPKSQEVSENDSVEFVCEALGLPKPVVSWYVNGKPIGVLKNNEKREIKDNIIKFRNIDKSDIGVIQCNATNKHGYVYGNAYLNVLEEAPSILESPKPITIVGEQKTAQLNCLVVGTPQPIVTWNRGHEQLTGGRFSITELGHLLITGSLFVDSGLYTCFAYNRFGNASVSGRLEVIRRTRIVTKPREIVIVRGSEAKFTCTATTDLNRIQFLKIDWMKDGKSFDYNDFDRVYKNDQDNSLTISSTIIDDTGRYSCIATNGVDSDIANAQLLVQAPPEPPMNVRSECFENENVAKVTWSSGRQNYSPIINFVVEYNTSFTPDRWITGDSYVASNYRRVELKLSNFNNYTFRVIARNRIGNSLPSLASVKSCQTNPGKPERNPKNVIVQGDLPDNLVIYWTPMLQSEHGGSKFSYLLKWRRSSLISGVYNKWNTHEVLNWTHNHYTVRDVLKTYKPYDVQVIAKNEHGNANEEVKIHKGYTGEYIPTARVKNLSFNRSSLTGNSVQLTWNDPIVTDETVKGFFRGYIIQYWTDSIYNVDIVQKIEYILHQDKLAPRIRLPRATNNETGMSKMRRTFTLVGLASLTKFYIHIRVMNKFYVGPASNRVDLVTEEGVPNRVYTFISTRRGPTFIEVAWTVSNQVIDATIVGFKICHEIVSSNRIQMKIFISTSITSHQRSLRIHGLMVETKYRITIYSFNNKGMGTGAYLETTTRKGTVPDPPVFTVDKIGPRWVQFVYESDEFGENPGSVFYIQYRKLGEFPWKNTFEQSDSYGIIRVITLEAFTPYEFRFVSKNSLNMVGFSPVIQLTTNEFDNFSYPFYYRSIWFWMSFVIVVLLLIAFVLVIRYYRIRNIIWTTKGDTVADQMRRLEAQEAVRHMAAFAGTPSRQSLQNSYYKPNIPRGSQNYQYIQD